MTNCRPNLATITWLFYITFLCAFIVNFIQAQQHEPTIWLIQPPARMLENGPSNQRLPERTCPTPSTNQDPLTQVPAGIPFTVQWHDPDQLPVDLAKLELFSSDAGHLLARLEVDGGEGGPNGSVLTMAKIPAGLRCASCVLRLSVELDERIQLLSCSQVRVEPTRRLLDEHEATECTIDGDCKEGGQCLAGQCFCREGFYGERCTKVNSAPIIPPRSSIVQSIRFPVSGSQFNWLASPQENALRIGLTIPSISTAPRWFILGLQSTEGDPKCQLAMSQWKQKLDEGNEGEEARAQAGVLIRVEQEKGENVLTGGDFKATAQGEVDKRPSKLNIHKLGNNGTEECGQNQRWEKCPESGRECEPSCDWTAQPESIPSCPPRTEQCGQPRCVCMEGFVRLSNSKDECKPFGFCQAPEVTATLPDASGGSIHASTEASTAVPAPSSSSIVGQCLRNETWEKCGTACEPSCSTMYSEELCGSGCEAPGCTCADNFVRSAEGKCILWSECPNLKERIGSINSTGSRAREPTSSTTIDGTATTQKGMNQVDLVLRESKIDQQICAGNETFNECGRVCETDCQSIFVRPECNECGQPACSCRQGYARLNGQCIYWGDCQQIVDSPESSTTSTTQAGHKHSGQAGLAVTTTIGPNRASSSIKSSTADEGNNEPPMDLCHGQWHWPSGCTGSKCLYSIQWAFDVKTDSVEFLLETRPAVSRKMPRGSPIWSGVGFSPSGTLLDADMIVIEADQQQGGEDSIILSIMDMHVDEQLEQLRLDKHQNAQIRQAQFANGLLKAKFSRKRRTGDAAGQDLEFGDEGNCFRFLFPVSGGRFEQSGNTSVPVADSLYASDSEICIRPCSKGNKDEEKVTTTLPAASNEDEEMGMSCQKEFRWPEGCKDEQCEYKANWAWEKAGDNVQFNISSRGIGRWTGIGFSRDGRMAGSDIITGWVYDHRAYLTDRFAHAQQQPAIDPLDRQDIFDVGGSLIDEIQSISFRRRVLSPDRATDLALAPQCMHFLFPVQGGRVLARSSRDFQQARTPIGFHDQQQPIPSTKKICLCDRPKDFQKAADQRKMGRAKRATTEGGGEGDAAAGGPYQCADIAIFQVVDGVGAVRVIDAFGLSNDSMRRDEMWNGRQSLSGVELSMANETTKMTTIWIRKTLKESGDEANADLSVQRGQIPVFLAYGQGPRPDMSRAERLEFAMVDLMAGAAEVEGQQSGKSSSTTTRADQTSSTTTTTTTNSTPSSKQMTTMANTILQQQGQKVEPSTEVDQSQRAGTVGEDTPKQQSSSIDVQPSPMPAPAFQPPPISPVDQSPGTEEPNKPETALMMDENCFGGFAFPEGCMQPASGQQCQYTLEWLVQPEAAKVHFQLNARMPPDHWTGIGFSADGAMVNADALVVLLLPDGQISVQDQFSPGYGRPNIDLRQNVEMVSTRSADGLWSVNFSRPLQTDDRQQDADLRECQHFLFLHSANPLMPGTGELRKHAETPVISENPICLGKCGQHKVDAPTIGPAGGDEDKDYTKDYEDIGTTTTTTSPSSTTTISTTTTWSKNDEKETTKMESSTTKMPSSTATNVPLEGDAKINVAGTGGGGGQLPKSKQTVEKEEESERTFNVAIRLPNERWDPKLEDTESVEFKEMSQKLSYSLQALIAARWPSLVDIRVQKFAEGSVLALLQIRFNRTAENAGAAAAKQQLPLPDAKQLKEFLQESAAQGMAAELILDREMLEVQEQRPPDEEEENRWGPLRELQGWLLAFLGFLLLCCIIGGLLFCAFRSRRRRHQHRTYPTKQQQHQMFYNGHGGGPMMMNTAQMFGNGNGVSGYQQGQYAPFPCEKDRESDTTTAKTSTTNGGGGQPQNGARVTAARRTETPRGIGEATYREWFSKVASKDAPSHYQDWQVPPPTPLPRGVGHPPPIASPYLSYPNDPAFYTLNGEHRIVPPPPAYYRPF